MNTVTVITVVGFLMFFSIGTAFILTAETEDTEHLDVNIIAKANINGSGIFATPSLELSMKPVPAIPGDEPTPAEIEAWKNAWSGTVFMTPGPGSIQHYMLNKFVVNDLGLDFNIYDNSKAPGAVYWTPVAPAAMLTFFKTNSYVDGGFPWEPCFSEVLIDLGFEYSVATSDELDEDHPCCMVAAKTSFLEANEGAVLRFLSAYVEALDWVNDALADKSGSDYQLLVTIAAGWTGKSTDVVSLAFESLAYMYDLSSGSTPLEDYAAALIPDFEEFKLINKHIDDPTAFASAFINHKYIDKVMAEKSDEYPSKKVKIRVGHLTADIHQIGLAVGIKLNLFDKYGVEVITTEYGNGPAVMTAFGLGVIDIGILGLPPALYGTANFR
ncbi:MAG: ABC transporter substrate-binding protein [Methanomassiliicoccaceae archaeon]|nr:ABC transporter substrate-binding protein [Methanomassiliicoccaceae archaeon]